MDNIVPLLYLSILSISLLVVSFFIGRQIIARKEIEDTLSVLQIKFVVMKLMHKIIMN